MVDMFVFIVQYGLTGIMLTPPLSVDTLGNAGFYFPISSVQLMTTRVYVHDHYCQVYRHGDCNAISENYPPVKLTVQIPRKTHAQFS